MKRLIAAAVLALVPALGHAATLDANFESTSNQGAQVGLTYSNLAQSFKIIGNGVLESIELNLTKKPNDVVGPAIIDLYSFGTSIGGSLGTATVAAADVSNSPDYEWVTFDFSGLGLSVSSGDMLAIGLYDGGSAENNQYAWNAGVDALATYADGMRYSSNDDGATWSAVPSWDMSFRVNLVPSPVPVPASLPLLALGLGVLGVARRRKTG